MKKYNVSFYKNGKWVDMWNVEGMVKVLEAIEELINKGYSEKIIIEEDK